MTERLHFHFSLSCIEEGNVNPLQCSCLENPRDRGAWWAAVSGVAQSQTWLKQLSSSSSSQYSCLENILDSGAWQATVHGVTKSWARLSTEHSIVHNCGKKGMGIAMEALNFQLEMKIINMCDWWTEKEHACSSWGADRMGWFLQFAETCASEVRSICQHLVMNQKRCWRNW